MGVRGLVGDVREQLEGLILHQASSSGSSSRGPKPGTPECASPGCLCVQAGVSLGLWVQPSHGHTCRECLGVWPAEVRAALVSAVFPGGWPPQSSPGSWLLGCSCSLPDPPGPSLYPSLPSPLRLCSSTPPLLTATWPPMPTRCFLGLLSTQQHSMNTELEHVPLLRKIPRAGPPTLWHRQLSLGLKYQHLALV